MHSRSDHWGTQEPGKDRSMGIAFCAVADPNPQVFVANPNKPPQIASILRRNKERLLVFLKDFHNDKEGEMVVEKFVWDHS